MIGTTLSHFSLTEKLGAGGMGEVHRGGSFAFVELDQADTAGTRIDVALHWARHLDDPAPR